MSQILRLCLILMFACMPSVGSSQGAVSATGGVTAVTNVAKESIREARTARLEFHADLHRRFAPAFVYNPPAAEELFFTTLLACPSIDDRILPLYSVLYYAASFTEASSDGSRIKFFVESQGSQVRVWTAAVTTSISSSDYELFATVDEWGGTRFSVVNRDTLSALCAGILGPYWLEKSDF